MKPLLLVDTASVYYRAFYSLPESITAKDGSPVNAVRGTIERFLRLYADHQPRRIIAAWDTEWRPAWRVKLIPSYKAHRLEETDGKESESVMPDSLSNQISLIEEVLMSMGIPVIGHEDYEADDIIGTLVEQSDGPISIVTGDRDLFQLINDNRNIDVIYSVQSKTIRVDESYVKQNFGISPEQYVDYAVLRGDPSDGLPGVRGIGPKTASSLINQFKNINELMSAAMDNDPSIKPRICQSIKDSKSYIAKAMQVVPVVRDVPIAMKDLNISSAPDHILDALSVDLNLKTTFQKARQILGF